MNTPDYYLTTRISQLREWIILHATLYYCLSINLISDEEYDDLVRELMQLQREYPEEAAAANWHKEYLDWDDGETACPSAASLSVVGTPWAIEAAVDLYEEHRGVASANRLRELNDL